MAPPDFQTFRRPCNSLTVPSSSRISWEFTKKPAKKHKRKAIKGEGGPVILLAVTGWAASSKHKVFSLASGCRQILKELKILQQDTMIIDQQLKEMHKIGSLLAKSVLAI